MAVKENRRRRKPEDPRKKMSISMQIVRGSFALFLVTLAMASSCSCRKHSVLEDGREMIELGDTDEVIWVVQISDLHISSYHIDRSISLQKLMGPLLNYINPSLVLITGDLTGFEFLHFFFVLGRSN